MPGNPPGHSRRIIGTTPIKRPELENVWHRSLYVLGLQELNAPAPLPTMTEDAPSTPDLETASPIASPTAVPDSVPTESDVPPKKKMNFSDLPLETKKEIFKHASSHDLITLSLVSKLFRDLAAERIYRSFHILFPDEDEPSGDVPFDCLAGGLDTFATSSYNYAQYLKELIMEAESGGAKGELAYRPYSNDLSCGKFLNTLLLLTLRRAKALERFQWDIRVELSRPVWKELHKMKALKHLHIRTQAGRSVYQPLPPLPNSILPPAPGQPDSSMPGSLLHPLPPILPVPAGSPNSFPFGNQIAKIYLQPPTDKVQTKAPPTLGSFKDLKTLTVLDMDTLEYLDELKECVRNSSGTLSSLKLSFSDALINSSRKPLPDPVSDDDSDQEDEFGQPIPPPGLPPINPSLGAADPNHPLKVLKAQEEKKKQETALAKIFGLDKVVQKPKHDVLAIVLPKPQSTPMEDPKRRFIRNLAPVAAKLMGHVKAGGDFNVAAKETLALIEKASQLYLDATESTVRTVQVAEEEEVVDVLNKKTDKAPASAESWTEEAAPASSGDNTKEPEDALMTGAVVDEPGLFDAPERKKQDSEVSNPEDFDVEGPDAGELIIESATTEVEVANDETPIPEPDPPEIVVAENVATDNGEKEDGASHGLNETEKAELLEVLAKHAELVSEIVQLEQEADAFAATVEACYAKPNPETKEEMRAIEATFGIEQISIRVTQIAASMTIASDRLRELREKSGGTAALTSAMTDYIRETRGLTLDSLSISMIPIKASVLSRGVDLHVLQSVTLLNVGPQSPFWNLLARENQVSPLPLHKIHTDNVTLPFLMCLSHLPKLTELVLMERVSKDRVESNASKSPVTIEQIRKLVLKKHVATLRILVIRNDTISMEWGLNIKTAMLLCERAKNLEELGCSIGTRPMHTFLQYLSGLTSLRALHVVSFHNPEDHCAFATREFRRFVVDVICHNPNMKLEYLALDNAVDRLVQRKAMPKPKVDNKGKGKEMNWTSAKALAELVMGGSSSLVNGSVVGAWSEQGKYDFPDSSDDEDGIVKTGLRIEIIDGIRFSDILGVRIFEREVVTGKL
ncbi:hypothetical protein VTL71DRAFT_8864 [Oculimacula yallundae]|uniref:F-box domain-containing protein n=1 Tax=Oculimacula yallundae TaxID=86028 RepID=A0ABR4BTX3_9HELO